MQPEMEVIVTGDSAGPAPSPSELVPLSPTVYHVLLALGDGTLHGYGIMESFEALTEGKETLLAGTLYATLGRMLDRGLVAEAEPPPGESSGGPKRRYYCVTDFGRAVARAESARLERLLTVAALQELTPDRA